MATLEEIEAEIARRQAVQQPAQQQAAVVPTIPPIEAVPAQQGFQMPTGLPQFGAPTTPQPAIPGMPTAPEFLTGAARETRATEELPELGAGGLLSGEDPSKIAAVTPVLLTTTNPREMGNILSSQFENVRITEDEKGNLIANNNATGAQVVINKPGVSQLDILQGLGIATAFTPAARVAATGRTAAQKALLGGTGAGLTETGMQLAQEQVGGEVDPEDIALASALGVGAEVALPLIQRFRQTRRAKQLGTAAEDVEEAVQAAATTRPATEATGVELFPAQQTQAAEALLEQRLIAQLPAGSKKAAQALRNQNKQTAAAVNDFLDQIAPAEAVITGPAKFRTAAQTAIERAKDIRAEKVSPIYKGAFKQDASVNLGPVNDLIKSELAGLPASGQMARSIGKVSRLIKESSTLEQLHNAKVEIDQMLNTVGDGSLGNTTKGKLVDIKNKLLTQMDDASDLYNKARKIFEAESPPVNQIQESIIGKIAKLDDVQLKRISSRIFDPAETNPAVIKQAKKVINDVDPDAWNQLLRSEIERKMGGLSADVSAETIENIPGQIHRVLFGNEKGRKILFNSVDGETAKNMKYLETVLKRASTGRAPGSPTIPFSEIRERINKGALKSIRDSFRQPIQTLASTGEEAAFNRAVRKLSNAVFDPQWKPQMAKLRKLNPNSPDAARAMVQLLNDVEKQEEK
jgi:hypothetical protein